MTSATTASSGEVTLRGARLAPIASAPPVEFGGPGDRWSPETLLTAAVADCFVLTFRAIARASRLEWMSLTCDAEGTLDRVERVTRFADFVLRVHVQVPESTNEDALRGALTKAKQGCLVSNSLIAPTRLEVHVETAAAVEHAATA